VAKLFPTFQLARCGCILRETSQTSYSPEYITPTHTHKKKPFKMLIVAGHAVVNIKDKNSKNIN
jgi:hypothetical protein